MLPSRALVRKLLNDELVLAVRSPNSWIRNYIKMMSGDIQFERDERDTTVLILVGNQLGALNVWYNAFEAID